MHDFHWFCTDGVQTSSRHCAYTYLQNFWHPRQTIIKNFERMRMFYQTAITVKASRGKYLRTLTSFCKIKVIRFGREPLVSFFFFFWHELDIRWCSNSEKKNCVMEYSYRILSFTQPYIILTNFWRFFFFDLWPNCY